jgi:hypothetical protein
MVQRVVAPEGMGFDDVTTHGRGSTSSRQRVTSEAFDPTAGVPDTKHGARWLGDYQGLAAGGGVLHALWNDTRTGNLELFATAFPIPTDAS